MAGATTGGGAGVVGGEDLRFLILSEPFALSMGTVSPVNPVNRWWAATGGAIGFAGFTYRDEIKRRDLGPVGDMAIREHADVWRSAEYLRRKSMDSAEQAGELIQHDTI